ncbi:RNI-like protein [Lichtheimia hyalospora FSU 10163]|nr:RNI-like protein [Lichtheimia hyalospora FSU 10163]
MSIAQCMPSELIVHILKYLTHPTDLSSSALTCKSWSLHALELLWYKPNFVQASAWVTFCNVLNETRPTLFPYTHYIRRINLSLLASDVEDSHLTALSVCERLERVTLTNCSNLTDNGIMDFLGTKSRKHLVSVDLSDVTSVTDASIQRIAETCPHLQGLNLSMCKEGLEPFIGVTDSSVIMLAQRCTGLRRIKLNNCVNITDASAIALAENCPALLEIDLMNCAVTNNALFSIFERSHELREFRLNQCALITDIGFTQSALAIPPRSPSSPRHYYDQLRILDLTAIYSITDDAVRLIISVAPKIRNLVLNKCLNITDESVLAICHLGRYLHYLHLGRCHRLTDFSIAQLARHCTRIRYLDLAYCEELTDRSVIELAALPKLKRIGLVKCTNITDEAIFALTNQPRIANSLERVHLSYCTKLTMPAIMQLVNFCDKLTHLSLTHVPAFIRPDLQQFRRAPPKDFTPQQREVFCVFTGRGVRDLRDYFNSMPPEAFEVPALTSQQQAVLHHHNHHHHLQHLRQQDRLHQQHRQQRLLQRQRTLDTLSSTFHTTIPIAPVRSEAAIPVTVQPGDQHQSLADHEADDIDVL